MGELTGELAEGYKRLMAKKQKVESSDGGDIKSDPAAGNSPTSIRTKPDENVSSIRAKFGSSADAKSVEVHQQAPSSTSGTRKGTRPSPLLISKESTPQRPVFTKRSEDSNSFAKLSQQRSNNDQFQEKENGKANEKYGDVQKEEQLVHVSSIQARSYSGISVETRRAGNTSKPAQRSRSIKLEVKPRLGTNLPSSSNQKSSGKEVIDPNPVEGAKAGEHTGTDKDSVDSFPQLDWHEIEHEARSITILDTSKDSELTPINIDNLVAEPFNSLKDSISVASARSQRSEQRLNAILEEQAETLFKIEESPQPEKPQKDPSLEDKKEAKVRRTPEPFKTTYNAIQFTADDSAVATSQQTQRSSTGRSANAAPSRTARTYHRPHSGEKVVIKEKEDEKKEEPVAPQDLVAPTDAFKNETEHKDDGDSKSDASGRPSWTSLHSEKKKKKGWNNKPKRRPRKTPPNRVQRKDGDPLGRAVSMAFDQIAGYAGFQEDAHSVTANEAHDEYTIDEEYLSDESENIIADIHDALFSTFGCTVPRQRQRQLNDDDTLETDGGSKVSANKFIRHARSGSDSVYSEPSLTIPSIGSYDKTEGTHEDDATDEMTDATKKSLQSKEQPIPENQAPKYKVPEEFDENPPTIPKALGVAEKVPPKNIPSSMYSDNTDTYRNFVEREHDAVNLLEEADDFLFRENIGKDFLKVANKKVDKLIASIHGFLQPNLNANKEDRATPPNKENRATPPNDPKWLAPTDPETTVEDHLDDEVEKEIDCNKEVTQRDFSAGSEEPTLINDVSEDKGSEPRQNHFATEEPIEREDSFFAASPKENSHVEHSSDSGSDQTLEDLKMMLIEEAREMPPIATNSESVVSSLVEEEKKEEESNQVVGENAPEGFEFVETFFSEAGNIFSQKMDDVDSTDGPRFTVTETEPFSDKAEPKIMVTDFGAKFGDLSVDAMPAADFQTNALLIDDHGFPGTFAPAPPPSQATEPVASGAEEIEVTKSHSVLVSSAETDLRTGEDLTPEPETKSLTEKNTSEAETTFLMSDDNDHETTVKGIDASDGNIEVPEPFPAFTDDESPVDLSFESIEVPMPPAPSLSTPKSEDISKSRNASKMLARSQMATSDTKKTKKGVINGLFRSFKKNKNPKPSQVASSSLARRKAPEKTAQSTSRIRGEVQPPGAKRQQVKKHSQSASTLKAVPPTKVKSGMKSSNSDVNNLMENYLSQKFEYRGSLARQPGSSDPWGGHAAKSASEVPKQRNDSVPSVFGEPFTIDAVIRTPDQLSSKKNDPFGFDISPIHKVDESKEFLQAWDVPDFEKPYADKQFQMASVFRREQKSSSSNEFITSGSPSNPRTPERKPGSPERRIPNTPVKWRPVQDHSNEGIDLRASSRSTSSSDYSQPPSINWKSVLDRAGKAAAGGKTTPVVSTNTSPQKVADFPFPSDVESQASF